MTPLGSGIGDGPASDPSRPRHAPAPAPGALGGHRRGAPDRLEAPGPARGAQHGGAPHQLDQRRTEAAENAAKSERKRSRRPAATR